MNEITVTIIQLYAAALETERRASAEAERQARKDIDRLMAMVK